MKKISSVICLSFLLIFLLVSNVYSFGWVKYKTDNDENVYFYKIRIYKTSDKGYSSGIGKNGFFRRVEKI